MDGERVRKTSLSAYFDSLQTMIPSVSVLVPAYNVASWVEAALTSALGSQGVDLEVIVVDDGSTDGTAEVAEAVAARDRRVVVVRLPENRGPSRARNAALDRATKTWVAVLDADDVVKLDRLARLAALGEAARADVVSDDVAIVREGAETAWTTMYEASGWCRPEGHVLTLPEFADMDWILKPLVRRSFLERHRLSYQEDFCHGEDFLIYTEILARGARWVTTRYVGYFYRKRERSITGMGNHLDHNFAATRAALSLVRDASGSVAVHAFERRLKREHEMAAWVEVRSAALSWRPISVLRLVSKQPNHWYPFIRIVLNGVRRRFNRGRQARPSLVATSP